MTDIIYDPIRRVYKLEALYDPESKTIDIPLIHGRIDKNGNENAIKIIETITEHAQINLDLGMIDNHRQLIGVEIILPQHIKLL